MGRITESIRSRIRKSIERDKALEKRVYAVSRTLWPWKIWRLPLLITILILLDFASTYAFLELSGNTQLYEGGPLAGWALRQGGFGLLFLVDMLAIGVLIGLAALTRHVFLRRGLEGYGRASFVVVLLPYTVVTFAIVFNNVVLTFI